jgi:phosphomannomutase/phosphoglucomutase
MNKLNACAQPVIKPTGFREYDARWLYPTEIDLDGMRVLGLAFGTLAQEHSIGHGVVSGYDYRSYSEALQSALLDGLVAAGCTVYDIGLALTPTAYFAQFALDVPSVAMVTASHNPNGWTGVKMGLHRPFTLEPEEMSALKSIVFQKRGNSREGGGVVKVADMAERYITDLTSRLRLKRRIKAVVACGNGTAGSFAPLALAAIGCEVVPIDCDLDHSFPNYDPNPEDLKMLYAVSRAVRSAHADIGFAFDGDGDRCGVIDNEGNAIFADKVGVLLARTISVRHPNAYFVVDVKSTALFQTDPVLIANGATTDYWKTGHSYIKRRMAEIGAIAGFEKSGHYFFREPLGRGYDDGLASAFAVCEMLDQAEDCTLADLYRQLPSTWSSPTMSPHCADDAKYHVVDKVSRSFEELKASATPFAGQKINELIFTNGVRVMLEDESWCIVRASSNKPELVVVCESLESERGMRNIFRSVEGLLAMFPEVGELNQKL